jgi:stage II sporulation protein D
MRLRLAMATFLLGIAGACVGPALPEYPGRLPSRVTVKAAGRVTEIPLDDYVLGSVLAEVSPVGEAPDTVARIFDVQAVLARTYAVAHIGRHHADGYDLCDTTHCELYDPARIATSRFADAARAAVARTSGEILTYRGRPAEALFHADCGGYTEAANEVWGTAVPYLLARPDDAPSVTHRHWALSVAADRLRTILNADARTRVGARLDKIAVRDRDASGRAVTIAISGSTPHDVRGDDFRSALNATLGDRAMQSTRVTIANANGTWTFDGTGFGHGVGLCQTGAAARARRGESLPSILADYFPGTTLVR